MIHVHHKAGRAAGHPGEGFLRLERIPTAASLPWVSQANLVEKGGGTV